MLHLDSVSDEARTLRALVVQYHGNLSALARALSEDGDSITRQAVTRKLHKFNLQTLAAELRTKHHVSGDREEWKAEERARLVKIVAASPTHAAAAERMGIHRRSLLHALKRHGVTPEEIEASR